MGGPSTRLLFEHIPKCGGTSLWNFLRHEYSEKITFHIRGKNPNEDVLRFQEMPVKERNKYRLVAGHGARNLIPYLDSSFIKFTVFRDPIERVMSYYYYVQRRPNHARHEEVVDDLSSLKSYLNSSNDGAVNNSYIRRFGPRKYVEMMEDPKAAVEETYAALMENFDHVGLLEDLEEFMRILNDHVDFHMNYDGAKQNVSSNRPDKSEINKEVAEVIAEKNSSDIALYKMIKDHWYNNKNHKLLKNVK